MGSDGCRNRLFLECKTQDTMRLLRAVLLVQFLTGSVYGGEGRGLGPGLQQWDYVEVRPGAHMFYWLYFTLAKVATPAERPLVLWLQGGPGEAASGYGNFEELGPLDIDLRERNATWVKEVNLVFVDSPVGSGFSFVDERSLVPHNNSAVARDLVTFTRLFLRRNPAFAAAPLFVFSQSYGGKMAAEFALALHDAIGRGELKAAFEGVALGSPWVAPAESLLAWAPFLLHTGMVDFEGFEKIQAAAEETRAAVEAGDWSRATTLWRHTQNVALNCTDNVDVYNILTPVPSSDPATGDRGKALYRRHEALGQARLSALLNGRVQRALGLSRERRWGAARGDVWAALHDDFMRPATHLVERLLAETHLEVSVYAGQLDLVVATAGTLQWVRSLRWDGAAVWAAAPRRSLVVSDIVHGFVKRHQRLAFYWVLRAGHSVASDNPKAGLSMLRRITHLKDS